MKIHRSTGIFHLFVCLFALFGGDALAEGAEYRLTSDNTGITFTLGSTLHTVHGVANAFDGVVRIPENLDPAGFQVEVTVDVKEMKTGNEERDEKMYHHSMDVETYPTVTFKSTALKYLPETYRIGGDFAFTLEGDLTIKGTTKNISFPVKATATEEGYRMNGSLPIAFIKDFGVKDPSVFIFRVKKEVELFIEVSVPYETLHAMASDAEGKGGSAQ